MRFVYFPILFKVGEKIIIDGDHAHHLINVVRISREEKITLLDGKGNFAIGKIDNISKRSIEFQVEQIETTLRPTYLSMAIPICRRENVESMIKSAVEIGVESMIFLLCDYSSSKLIDSDRIERLIISAMEQSGNNFHPKILPTMGMIEFVSSGLFDNYFVPSSQLNVEKELTNTELGVGQKNVLVIGPGGWILAKRTRITC